MGFKQLQCIKKFIWSNCSRIEQLVCDGNDSDDKWDLWRKNRIIVTDSNDKNVSD